jgi:hypothetical protein
VSYFCACYFSQLPVSLRSCNIYFNYMYKNLLASLSIQDWVAIVSLLFSIIGTLCAVIQTYRAHEANKRYNRKKREQNASIWHNISMVLNTYETLEDAREYAKNAKFNDNGRSEALLAKISSARRCVVDQYLILLKAAVLDEPEFNEQTLRKWISQGRLENEWRIDQARKLIFQQG